VAFIEQLEAFKSERLAPIIGAGQMALASPGNAPGDATKLLQIALANEINVSELAAAWMPSTREIDVKLAFARQAGDEAGHFQLVADRLAALGFDVATFTQTDSPLFQYLRSLTTSVERIAAGLFTLESIAYGVNENFIAFCDGRGDTETVRIYREYIQPDEQAHQQLGQRLLAKYATTPDLQQVAHDTVARVLDISGTARANAASRLGTACFPGC
jgi:uncharacterized ferritin-like protein (DUF455 family)